jgi:hypothetical protein
LAKVTTSVPDPDPYSDAQPCKQEATAPPASPALEPPDALPLEPLETPVLLPFEPVDTPVVLPLEPPVALPLEPLETPVLLPFEPVDTPVVLPLEPPVALPLEPLETPVLLPLEPLEVSLVAPLKSPLELGVELPAHPAAMAAQVAGMDDARMRRKVRARVVCFTENLRHSRRHGKNEAMSVPIDKHRLSSLPGRRDTDKPVRGRHSTAHDDGRF